MSFLLSQANTLLTQELRESLHSFKYKVQGMSGLREGEDNTRKHPLDRHEEMPGLDRHRDFQRDRV